MFSAPDCIGVAGYVSSSADLLEHGTGDVNKDRRQAARIRGLGCIGSGQAQADRAGVHGDHSSRRPRSGRRLDFGLVCGTRAVTMLGAMGNASSMDVRPNGIILGFRRPEHIHHELCS